MSRVGRAFAIGWPALVWVLLWGDLSAANVIAGLVIGVAVVVLFPMPVATFPGRVRPVRLLGLAVWFLGDLVRGSLQVAVLALRPGPAPQGAVVGVQLRTRSDLYLTITAQIATLIPGSLVVEADRTTGMLYLHVLDAEGSGGPEATRRAIRDLEERVLRALAGDDELARAGLVVPGSGRARRGPGEPEGGQR